jgi:hypothetical protein
MELDFSWPLRGFATQAARYPEPYPTDEEE